MVQNGPEGKDFHGEYFRTVFGFAGPGAGEVAEVPDCHTWYAGAPGDKQYHEPCIALDDIPTCSFDHAPFRTEDTTPSPGDPQVETMQGVGTADTEPVIFLVTCS